MPTNPIPDDINRQDILQALRDLDSGVEHAFGDSTGYDLVFDGRHYPPKAVVGLAARRSLGRALGPYEFKGGLESKCFRVLQKHGFDIVPKPDQTPTAPTGDDWTDAELRAAVEAYVWMQDRERRALPYTKAAVNRELRERSLAGRSKGSIEYRMQNISAVLLGLGGTWISGYKPAGNVGATTTARIEEMLRDLGALNGDTEQPTADPVELDNRTKRLLRRGLGKKTPRGNDSPKRVAVTVDQFERDPAVRAYALARANGACELCRSPAPFSTVDGAPYLEVHHIIPLASGGPDTTENAVALCPNCHRKCHYAADGEALASELQSTVNG